MRQPTSNFHQVGNTIEAGNSRGIDIFRSYISNGSSESSKLPKIDGAQGFDPEADSLILVFETEEVAQAGLKLLLELL